MSIRGEDLNELKRYGALLKEEMYRIPGIVDIEVSREQDTPEFRLKVDREKTVNSGAMTSNIVRTVGALVGGQAVTTYEDEDGDAVDVRVRLPEELRQDPAQVEQLRLSVPQQGGPAALLPIGGLVTYERADTPSQVDRTDLTREVVVSGNLEGLALGTAVQKVKEAAKKLHMPPEYRIVFSGEAEDMAESFGYLGQALILAIILVYLILAAQFESFIDPLSIMLSLPLSLIGMAAMLYLTHDKISMISLIGLIMLMGLVTKNRNPPRRQCEDPPVPGHRAKTGPYHCRCTRFRPIMMTTLAMIFGMLPDRSGHRRGRGDEGTHGTGRYRWSHHFHGAHAGCGARCLRAPRRCRHPASPEEGRQKKRGGYRLMKRYQSFGGGRSLIGGLAASLLIMLVASQGLCAGQTRIITLDEALQITLENNKDIQKAEEYRRKVMGIYVEKRADALPQLTAIATGSRSWDQAQASAQSVGPFTVGPVIIGPITTPPNIDRNTFLTTHTQPLLRGGRLGPQSGRQNSAWPRLVTSFAFRQAALRDVSAAFYDALLASE